MKRVGFCVLSLMFLLTGCSTPQTLALRQAPASAENGVVELKAVPFFPQADGNGATAALAALLGHAGRSVTPEELSGQLSAADGEEARLIEMAAVARRQGRLVYPLAPQLDAVLAALHQGFPVLVRQNNGLSFFPSWRYAVVVGADRAGETFWLRSGESERLAQPFAAFERSWSRGGSWGVLLVDPRQIPDTLDARMVIRELALMERAGAVADAQAGFNAAVLNWPEQKPAWLGLASASLALGQIDRAESTLRELVRRAPQYGAGLNNLADLLLKTGRPLEAMPLAERAVAVLDIPATRGTLEAAHQALQPLQAEALPAQPGDLAPGSLPPLAKTKASARKASAGKRTKTATGKRGKKARTAAKSTP